MLIALQSCKLRENPPRSLSRSGKKPLPGINSHRKGFALVISLALMAFIFLLLLALTALVQIEIRSSTQNQQMTEARANALLGLNIALGQLQQYAGADQRVTAQANLLYTESITGNPTNPSLSQRQTRNAATRTYWANRNPYWTGVWNSTLSAQNQLPIWLVSGNERFMHDFASTQYAEGYAQPQDTERTGWIPMVTASTSDPDQFPYRFSQEVVVPAVEVASPLNESSGRYAYWVADLGVKTSLGYRDPRKDILPGNPDYNFRLMSPHRHSLGNLSDFESLPEADAILDDRVPDSFNSLAVALALDDTLPTLLRNGFHDYTLLAANVISDVKRGGLKIDLTPYLEANVSSSAVNDNAFIIRSSDYLASDPMFQGSAGFPNSSQNLPRWGLVRSWYNRTATSGLGLAPSPRTETSPGIYPQLGFYRLNASMSYVNTEADSRLRFYILPQIGLWNPYDVPIEGATYDFEIYWPANITELAVASAQGTLNSSGGIIASPDPGALKWHAFEAISNNTAQRTAPHKMAWRLPDGSNPYRWTFRLVVPRLEPGEILAFFPENTEAYDGSNELVPAFDAINPDALYVDSPFLLEDPLPEASEAGEVRYNLEFRRSNNINIEPWPITNADFITLSLGLGGNTLVEVLQLPNDRGWATRLHRLGINTNQTTAPYLSNPDQWRYLYNNNYWDIAPISSTGSNTENAEDKRPYRFHGIPPYAPTNIIARVSDFQGRASPSGDIKVQHDLRLFANYNVLASDWSLNPVDAAREYQPLPAEGLPDRLHYYQRDSAESRFNLGNNYLWTGATNLPRYGMLDRFSYTDAQPRNDPIYPVAHVRRNNSPMVSLGKLQHVPFSRFSDQPIYAFGNAEASPYVRREGVTGFRSDRFTHNNLSDNRQVDLSWLLNDAIWDRYFLSTLPQSGSLTNFRNGTEVLPNPAMRFTGPLDLPDSFLRDPETAAEGLLLQGGFNVNSTSVEAWKSLLGATLGLQDSNHEGAVPGNAAPIKTRSSYATGPIHFHPDRTLADQDSYGGRSGAFFKDYSRFWGGSRYLTEPQIDELAQRIVDEVRARGPFLSLSDFVNRRLVVPDSFNKTLSGYDPFVGLQGLNGTLQRAINLSGINGGNNSPHNSTDDLIFNVQAETNNNNRRYAIFPNNNYHYLDTEHRAGVPAGTPHTASGQGVSETGQKLAHAPGFLTQADLLTVIGPLLNARSDTFLVRAYGDSVNPLTGRPGARAWCEATIQRLPEEITPGSNERRFAIVDFRWLNEAEL